MLAGAVPVAAPATFYVDLVARAEAHESIAKGMYFLSDWKKHITARQYGKEQKSGR